MEGTITRVTHKILDVMSLLLVGIGLLLSATFVIDVPLAGSAGAVADVQKVRKQPETPAITKTTNEKPAEVRKPEEQPERKPPDEERKAVEVPKDKRLKLSVPKMKRVHDDLIPYASVTDEQAFKNYAAVHLQGTGFPWDREANIYIAGHRLGFPNTESWLSFWDLNKVDVGDRIYVTDSRGRKYEYKVFKDFVVDPKDVFVVRPLKGKNIVTLQTCTLPDFSRRLIVQAERVA